MAFPEIRDVYEDRQGLKEWLAQIEFQWHDFPEFKVDPQKFRHLAIICDGNRRAAIKKGLKPYLGHRAGIEIIRGITRACREWKVSSLSFWLWSTENWERKPEQVEFIMQLAAKHLADDELLEEFCQHQVRFTHFGRKDRLPSAVVQTIENLERQTASFDQYRLNLVIDYGGLDEMARGIGRMFEAFRKGEFNPEILKQNPQAILGFLDTAGQVLPDLVIRTGCPPEEIPHTSGFMPLQTAYSGWVFLPDLFPDLTPQTLLQPIKSFLEYERRFGR